MYNTLQRHVTNSLSNAMHVFCKKNCTVNLVYLHWNNYITCSNNFCGNNFCSITIFVATIFVAKLYMKMRCYSIIPTIHCLYSLFFIHYIAMYPTNFRSFPVHWSSQYHATFTVWYMRCCSVILTTLFIYFFAVFHEKSSVWSFFAIYVFFFIHFYLSCFILFSLKFCIYSYIFSIQYTYNVWEGERTFLVSVFTEKRDAAAPNNAGSFGEFSRMADFTQDGFTSVRHQHYRITFILSHCRCWPPHHQ